MTTFALVTALEALPAGALALLLGRRHRSPAGIATGLVSALAVLELEFVIAAITFWQRAQIPVQGACPDTDFHDGHVGDLFGKAALVFIPFILVVGAFTLLIRRAEPAAERPGFGATVSAMTWALISLVVLFIGAFSTYCDMS
jgi:hypothetical protein